MYGKIFTRDQEANLRTRDDYNPTPYDDQSWEIVGEVDPNAESFVPMEITILREEGVEATNPMFQDYGGCVVGSAARFWHLPQSSAYIPPEDETKKDLGPPKRTLLESELEEMLEKAKAQGRDEATQALATVQLEESRALQHRVLELFSDAQKQLLESLKLTEQQAVRLAVEIAERLVGFAVEINPEYIVEIVRRSLGLAGNAKVIRCRVSPQDHEFITVLDLRERLKEFEGDWNFEADESVRAGCVLETSAGEVDMRVDQAMERVKENVVRIIR